MGIYTNSINGRSQLQACCLDECLQCPICMPGMGHGRDFRSVVGDGDGEGSYAGGPGVVTVWSRRLSFHRVWSLSL